MSRTISASIGLLFLFLFIALFGLTGCEDTVTTVVEIKHDTVTKTDTLYRPEGSAFIRFVSLLPNRNDANILLYWGQGSAPFGEASSQMRSEYHPAKELSGFPLYTSFRVNSVSYTDSITIDPLDPCQTYTCALFQFYDPDFSTYRLKRRIVHDSMKVIPPQEGMAYLRLINGLDDYPNPETEVNMRLKSPDSANVFEEPIQFSHIGNYFEVPAGTYPIYIVSPDESSPLYEQQYVFAPKGYYTAMLVGQKAQGTDKLVISVEN